MPSIPCPLCGVKLNVPESAFGQTRPCPFCQQRVRLQRPKPADAITGLNFEDKELFEEDDSAADFNTTQGKKRKAPQGAAPPPVPASGPLKKPAKKPAKTKKKPAADDAEVPPWVLPAMIGGVAALFVIAIGILMVGGGSGTAAPPISLSRDPQRGPNSFVPYAPPTSADATLWKVTVDNPLPPPASLESVFGAPRRDAVVAFASPAAATAAVLDRRGEGTQWTQYHLAKSQPVRQVEVPGNFGGDRQSAPVVALSPQGTLLALRGSGAGGEKRAVLFREDGGQMASFEVEAPEGGITWLSLPTEERLLALAGTRLLGFDIPSGKEVFAIDGIQSLPSTSHGGKWVAALTANGIAWHATTDGAAAGVSPLPEAWFAHDSQLSTQQDLVGKRLARVAFSRTGRTAAIVVVNPHSDVHIAEVDLSNGQIRDAFVLPNRQTQEVQKLLDAAWVGDRHLLFPSGMLVDLDLKTWLVRYEPGTWCGAGPDGRYWRVLAGAELRQSDKLSGHQAVLAAVTLPDAVAMEQLRDARGGFAWHPGQEVRVEVAGNLPDKERDATIEAFAALLVQRGMQIRPGARLGARLNIGVRPGLVTGKSRPSIDTTDRADDYKQGQAGTLRISIVDEHGNPMLVASAPDEKPDAVMSTYGGSSAEHLWRQLRARIDTLRLPRLYFRTGSGKRLLLSRLEIRRAQAGIDGIAKPTYPVLDGIPDPFALPSDRDQ